MQDLFAAPIAMRGWAKMTTRPMELAMLEGDHYFIEAQRPVLASIVASRLGRAELAADPAEIRWQTITAEEATAMPPLSNENELPRSTLKKEVAKNLFAGKRSADAKLRVV